MNGSGGQRTVARAEISELLALWVRTIDSLDWGTLRDEVFAEEVDWEWEASDGQAKFTDATHGRSESVAWFAVAIQPGTRVRHFTTDHLFDWGGDRVRTTSYMIMVNLDSLLTVATGVVTAEHVRMAVGWRIRRLRVEEQIAKGAMAKQVPMRAG